MTKRNSKRKKTKNAKWKHLRTKLDAADEWKLIQKNIMVRTRGYQLMME